MALSKITLEHLLDAESSIRAAIKSAAVNEKSVVVKQLSDILINMEQTKKFDQIMDMIDNREHGSKGMFGHFFNDDEDE